ncbi:MAG TPA: leucyl aminopeptidase [Candidatus Limnocylindrales bacterium]|nr:leucyl aminopeptidase [Candidatus Limnocylindrales bacterium]
MQFRTISRLDGEQVDAVIVPVFKEGNAAASTPDDLKELAEWVAKETGGGKLFTATTHLDRGNGSQNGRRVVVVAAGSHDDYDVQRAWQVIAAGMRSLWNSTAERVAVVIETHRLDNAAAVQSAVEGVSFAMWRPESHRTSDADRQLPPVRELLIVSSEFEEFPDNDEAVARGQAVGDAVNWARTLANEPGNHMTPKHVAEEARQLASQTGLEVQVIGEDEARSLGMGSFLSVARGSDEEAQVVVLRHRGRDAEGYDLALVGKGITFDSGGISLKDPTDMHLMKYDMSGAAAVLAVAGVVARLKLPMNLLVVAMCTENLPGGHATKPGDVFTSMSGKTVEVTNTDAEGRLVLIDGITYAQREGAARVVDVATLTGAVAVALGRHYTGLFGRPEGFVDAVRRAGELAGERLWPMPLSDEYRDEMKSEIADLRNSAGRMGGAILGAAFVDAAVEEQTEWAHLDIASTAWSEEERLYTPKGPQGSSVRTLVQLAGSIAARNS